MFMKETNYVMKIMCKWMTLDDFGGEKHGGTIVWKAPRQPMISVISSRLGCTTSSDIKLMTTIKGGIFLYWLKGHGILSFGNI